MPNRASYRPCFSSTQSAQEVKTVPCIQHLQHRCRQPSRRLKRCVLSNRIPVRQLASSGIASGLRDHSHASFSRGRSENAGPGCKKRCQTVTPLCGHEPQMELPLLDCGEYVVSLELVTAIRVLIASRRREFFFCSYAISSLSMTRVVLTPFILDQAGIALIEY